MPPVSILIKPASSLCNMKCKYCFYADVADHREVRCFGLMDETTLEALVKRVFEYATEEATFSFQGGEPTLAGLPFYEKLIALQKQYNTNGIRVSNALQTNGCLLDEHWARFFGKNRFLIGLSMDGTAELHNALRVDGSGKGTYNRVKKAADLLEKHGVDFNILCVVNNFVAAHPKKVYSALKKYGYLQFIACLDPFGGEKKAFSLTCERYGEFLIRTFEEYYRDFLDGKYVSVRNFDNYVSILAGHPPESCAARGVCTCYLVVEGDGSVYPCDFYVLDEWRLGNVGTESIPEMLSSARAADFVALSVQRPQECRVCPYFRLCRGGCRRECEPITNERMSLNTYCSAYKHFFDTCLEKLCHMASVINAQKRM